MDNKTLQTTAGDAAVPDGETRTVTSAPNFLPEVRLVMLGWRWPGKSLTGNTIIGREEFRLERAAEFCVTRQSEVQGRQVTVVDTPGWFSVQDTPLEYKQELVRGASLCPPGPHAFLLVVPVGMFTDVDRARIEEHVSLFGERVWKHTIVVFNWADVLAKISIERYIRREGKELQWVLEKCQRRYFVINNCIFGENPQVEHLLERVEKMVAEEGGYYIPEVEGEKKPLDENQNPARDVRELGARPKQNSRPGLTQAMEVETLPTQ
ncbi:GTPase IMAP family member 4 [Takifugu rubripes]|uniref:GTPase IMAP family member 4-like n=1 Tax=Takifugu rubripes TaxID=31033 RepID=A0A674P7V5_TAKRU|nr:GTPase IMAP family member 4-like [Takifugu rubripes]|eukprot:XP_003968099.1 PREDICTED: GTPase IMAP family member 4-like [Takifugu rubripes]